MFVDMVRGPRSDWESVREASGMLDDPPPGLVAVIVVPDGEDDMIGITVWDTPGQRGEFAAQRMMPLFESGALADVTSNPDPVTPISLYFRD